MLFTNLAPLRGSLLSILKLNEQTNQQTNKQKRSMDFVNRFKINSFSSFDLAVLAKP